MLTAVFALDDACPGRSKAIQSSRGCPYVGENNKCDACKHDKFLGCNQHGKGSVPPHLFGGNPSGKSKLWVQLNVILLLQNVCSISVLAIFCR